LVVGALMIIPPVTLSVYAPTVMYEFLLPEAISIAQIGFAGLTLRVTF